MERRAYRSADFGNQPALSDTESSAKTEKTRSRTGQTATYRMGANPLIDLGDQFAFAELTITKPDWLPISVSDSTKYSFTSLQMTRVGEVGRGVHCRFVVWLD